MNKQERTKQIEEELLQASDRAALLRELQLVESICGKRPGSIQISIENQGESPVHLPCVFNQFQAMGAQHDARRECFGPAILEVLEGYRRDLCERLGLPEDHDADVVATPEAE